MYPITLNLTVATILLIGRGHAFDKRKSQLLEAGALHMTAIEDDYISPQTIASHAVIIVAGLDRQSSEAIANEARAQKKLVNVEDVSDLCDFYFTAHVKRGDLLIAVSTNGASPTLAKRVRTHLAEFFGEEWNMRTQSIKALRDSWQREGKSMPEIAVLSEAYIDREAWFEPGKDVA